jgi:hypothetical protein
MDRLEREGLISRHKGKGTFVKSNGGDRHLLHLATQWESLLDSIRDNQPTQIPIDSPPPLPSLGECDARPALQYVFLRSVQARDGDPYALVNVHLAKDIYDRDPEKFQTHAVLPTLADMNDVTVIKARQTLLIGGADPYTEGGCWRGKWGGLFWVTSLEKIFFAASAPWAPIASNCPASPTPCATGCGQRVDSNSTIRLRARTAVMPDCPRTGGISQRHSPSSASFQRRRTLSPWRRMRRGRNLINQFLERLAPQEETQLSELRALTRASRRSRRL